MNFYTLAKKMRREISRRADDIKHIKNDNIFDNDNDRYEQAKLEAIKDFDATTRLGIELMLKYREIAEDMGLTAPTGVKRTFMITVRPENKSINIHTFIQDTNEFLKRKMFEKIYGISYEQKGVTDDCLGWGFHFHLIAQTTCRSKGEVLENTYNTFKHYTAKQCIQVDVCKNPEQVIQKYLIDYKSKDEHKEMTKEWDIK